MLLLTGRGCCPNDTQQQQLTNDDDNKETINGLVALWGVEDNAYLLTYLLG